MEIIYLDNAATTKPNEQFFVKAKDFALENYYNPSALYRGGRKASDILKSSKQSILKNFPNKKLIFTSCGTEADNTAVFGYFKRGNAVSTLGEHSAIFASLETLRNKGQDVRYAKLNKDGSVNVEDFLSKIDCNTTFASVVHINNETGAINDINYLSVMAKKIAPRLIFHSDGVQAFGKCLENPGDSVDLYSVSAHKIGGLKGVGALIYNANLKIPPYIIGGGQEDGLRSGTENVLGIYDFALCSQFAYENKNAFYENAMACKNAFIQNLDYKNIKIISSQNASPYVLSLTAFGLRGEVLQHMLEDEGLVVGTGSACSSKHPHSRVLKECGYSSSDLDGVIRISFIFDSEVEKAVIAAKTLNLCVEKLSKVVKG